MQVPRCCSRTRVSNRCPRTRRAETPLPDCDSQSVAPGYDVPAALHPNPTGQASSGLRGFSGKLDHIRGRTPILPGFHPGGPSGLHTGLSRLDRGTVRSGLTVLLADTAEAAEPLSAAFSVAGRAFPQASSGYAGEARGWCVGVATCPADISRREKIAGAASRRRRASLPHHRRLSGIELTSSPHIPA